MRNDAPRGINQQVFGASPARGRSKTIWKKLVARAYSKAQLTFIIWHIKTNNNNLLDGIKCFLSFPSPLLATCKTTARQKKKNGQVHSVIEKGPSGQVSATRKVAVIMEALMPRVTCPVTNQLLGRGEGDEADGPIAAGVQADS